MLPSHGRRHNLSLALQLLYTSGPMSRADLARRLGISKVTVSDLVAEVIESGHAVELGPSDQVRPGKPATLVDVNRTGLQAIGVDLAAHEVLRAAVLDLDGNILVRAERRIADDTGEAIVAIVLDLVQRDGRGRDRPPPRHRGRHARASSWRVASSTPRPTSAGATCLCATSSPMLTGLPVFVANDADAAVHADHTLGDGGDDLVLVKIGRGVGCGLIVGGQRVRGAHFAAGEIGHVTVGTDGGAVCRCGKTGCLETWVSAPRLEQALAASR